MTTLSPISLAAPRTAPIAGAVVPVSPADASLVPRVAAAFEEARIRYCQWKGRLTGLPRGARRDVDLLVDRAHAGLFAEVVTRLGFKAAQAPAYRHVPGVLSYLGRDAATDELVHLHVHYQLFLGSSGGRGYRLPIESQVLDRTIRRVPWRSPAPEFELLLLVARTTLRYRLIDGIGDRDRSRLEAVRRGVGALRAEIDDATFARLLACGAGAHIGAICFEQCLAALQPDRSPWRRRAARRALAARLASFAWRAPVTAFPRRVLTRVAELVEAPLPPALDPAKRLVAGGAVVALVGADGAGKSTGARGLQAWLAGELLVRRAHLGRPPRSLATLLIGAAAKIAGQPPHLRLLRHLCTARDRYRAARRAWRVAAAGGVALCERYPMTENAVLVGPSRVQGRAREARGPLARLLRRWEERYYARIPDPEVVLVLRVDPATAVARKRDEPAPYVRARAELIDGATWESPGTRVVDATQPLPAVLAALRAAVWELV